MITIVLKFTLHFHPKRKSNVLFKIELYQFGINLIQNSFISKPFYSEISLTLAVIFPSHFPN